MLILFKHFDQVFEEAVPSPKSLEIEQNIKIIQGMEQLQQNQKLSYKINEQSTLRLLFKSLNFFLHYNTLKHIICNMQFSCSSQIQSNQPIPFLLKEFIQSESFSNSTINQPHPQKDIFAEVVDWLSDRGVEAGNPESIHDDFCCKQKESLRGIKSLGVKKLCESSLLQKRASKNGKIHSLKISI